MRYFLLAALVLPASVSSYPWLGVDMSQILTEPACCRLPSSNNSTMDPFKLMRAQGVNAFRMRLWNDPCADGRCDPRQYSYANLSGVLRVAKATLPGGQPCVYFGSSLFGLVGRPGPAMATQGVAVSQLRRAYFGGLQFHVPRRGRSGQARHTAGCRADRQ